MKTYVIILFMFISISCISQNSKKYIISQSTIKLEGKNTNIWDFLEIGGYYRNDDFGGSYSMFFEDGIYVKYFYFKEGATEDSIRINMVKWIKWPNDMGRLWGVFRIEGDTLIGLIYDKGNIFRGITFSEERYKIINRITLKRIYWKEKTKEDDKNVTYDPWIDYDFSYHFVPADSLPSSDCWLKEEKWIWRNESDWKAYMEKIKQKKQK